MKALYFAKIDYIRSRTQMYLIFAMLLVVTLILKFMTDGTDMMFFLYDIFIVIVFSTVPFGNCSKTDAGFLQLLPAATWQRVSGRFLYGFSLLLIGSVIGIGYTAVYRLPAGTGTDALEMPLYMIVLATGLLIITVQYILLYLIGENYGAQFLSIVRMVPGMSFYFGSVKLIGEVKKNPALAMELLEMVDNRPYLIGWGSVAVSLAVMALGVILCTRVTERRDC